MVSDEVKKLIKQKYSKGVETPKKSDKEKMKDSESEFEKVKKLLDKKRALFNKPYVLRQLREKDNLRKVFLSTIKNNPARISEIYEDAVLTKPTCYTQLHKLMELNLVGRVFVLDVQNGVVKNSEVKRKFEEWVKSMPETLKRYYLAKTSYWIITDFGKNFAMKSYEFEQEFRENSEGESKSG